MNVYLVNLCDDSGLSLHEPENMRLVWAEAEEDVDRVLTENGIMDDCFISGPLKAEYDGWKKMGVQEIRSTED